MIIARILMSVRYTCIGATSLLASQSSDKVALESYPKWAKDCSNWPVRLLL